MGYVKIVTDSTADIFPEVREQFGIKMIPLKVLFREETYLDAIDLTADNFYDKLKASEVLPTTSQPSPAEFSELYEEILNADPECQIISIHISSVLSGTYQSATIAKSMLDEDKESRVFVVDGKSASFGTGNQVLLAAEMASKGASVEAILDALQSRQENYAVYFLVDTLEYLQKGGRIGKAASLVGSLLSIKPILSLEPDGRVFSLDKARGQKKAIARTVELAKERFGDARVNVVVAYADDKAPALELEAKVVEGLNVQEVQYTTVGAVIGTYTGPGVCAVFIYKV
jgi:DegV family protein with EDD domain